MKIPNIKPTEIKIIPTKKKFERAAKLLKAVTEESGLPKEMPVERPVYIPSSADVMEQIKNKIQITIESMKG